MINNLTIFEYILSRSMIYFPYNSEKAEAIAYRFAELEGGKIDKLKLTKLIYLLERKSIKEQESPIIGGYYVSFQNGPAISPVLDDIDKDCWESLRERSDYLIHIQGNIDQCVLSEWENEEIIEIYSKFGKMNQFELVQYTHENCPEWEEVEKGSCRPIDITKILDRDTSELEALANDLNIFSKYK